MRAALSVASLMFLAGTADGRQGTEAARAFLEGSLALETRDLADLDRGLVVTRTLDVTDRREVATLGVVRLKITPEFYAGRLADIANFKKDPAILQIGTFGDPPRVSDVAGMTLDESDVRTLRSCRVGDCGMQLPAAAIERFRREIDWRAGDATRRANGIMREVLVDHVARYRRSGGEGAMQYADNPERVDPWREFASLAGSDIAACGLARFPQLREHLLGFPEARAANTNDVIYWSTEKVGRRAVVSVTHLAIWKPAGDAAVDYAMASTQLYGSHYFDASLGLTVLLRDRSATSPATYLGYVNRTRVDVFRGPFGRIARRIVSSKARSTVADQLARIQRTLEPQFAASQSSPSVPAVPRPEPR